MCCFQGGSHSTSQPPTYRSFAFAESLEGSNIQQYRSNSKRRQPPGVPAYNASKHAVIGLTRSAAAEWAPRGIRINAVCPGPIESRMMTSLEQGLMPGDLQGLRTLLTGRIPAARYGTAEEVAALVAFLASEDARYIVGSMMTVDGGLTGH